MRSERVAFVVGLGLAACSPDEPAHGIRLDVAPGFEACDGQAAYVDGFARAVFGTLEQPVPESFDMTLHIVDEEAVAEVGHCPPTAVGCAIEGEAWSSRSQADLHEVTHMILRTIAAPAMPAMEEGMAEALGTALPTSAQPAMRLPMASYALDSWAELDSAENIEASLYASFLLERHGPSAYLEAFASLPRGSSLEQFEGAFEEHFGAPIAGVDQDYVRPDEPRCTIALGFCGDEVLGAPLVPPFDIEHTLACDESGTLGFNADDGSRQPFRLFQMEIPETGTYEAVVFGALFGAFRCGPCEERSGEFFFNGSVPMPQTVELEAGRYSLILRELFDGEASARLSLERVRS